MISLDPQSGNSTPIRLALAGGILESITLRDVFAIVELYRNSGGFSPQVTAHRAYAVADAMLAAREGKA